jgi:mannose-1-phosphate guanylyltransferase
MAGGIGSRFWPMSTEKNPKQFLDFLGTGKSLIQMTFERLLRFIPADQIYILTNESYKEQVLEQLPAINEGQVLCEPMRKNTAPCIAYAAGKLYDLNENANLIVTPADHLVIQEDRFATTVKKGIEAAEGGDIVTIGIKPTRPDTGYGYIEFGQDSETTPNTIHEVTQFREKPDLDKAKAFVAAGNFYWNAGVFIWKAKTIIDSLASYEPEVHELFTTDLSNYNTEEEQSFVNKCFAATKDISIDYAIMERADNIRLILADFDWSDLGTWGSLYAHLEKDQEGNSVQGENVKLFNSRNTLIKIEDGTEAVIDSLDGYIVVQSENRIMILKNENEQELKNFLK